MGKYTQTIHHVDFSNTDQVKELLRFLRDNKAKVTAYDKTKSTANCFAVLTKYRDKA